VGKIHSSQNKKTKRAIFLKKEPTIFVTNIKLKQGFNERKNQSNERNSTSSALSGFKSGQRIKDF
jgi:hypothetical protein